MDQLVGQCYLKFTPLCNILINCIRGQRVCIFHVEVSRTPLKLILHVWKDNSIYLLGGGCRFLTGVEVNQKFQGPFGPLYWGPSFFSGLDLLFLISFYIRYWNEATFSRAMVLKFCGLSPNFEGSQLAQGLVLFWPVIFKFMSQID